MVPERHYCIPPLNRIDLEEVLELVEDMRYFALHAPRQSGKTSILLALADALNDTDLRSARSPSRHGGPHASPLRQLHG